MKFYKFREYVLQFHNCLLIQERGRFHHCHLVIHLRTNKHVIEIHILHEVRHLHLRELTMNKCQEGMNYLLRLHPKIKFLTKFI